MTDAGQPGETAAQAIGRRWRGMADGHPGIEVWVEGHPRGEETVEVMAVWSHRERGAGHASRAMRALAGLADELGVTLRGQVHRLRYDTDHPVPGETEMELDRLDALNDVGLGNVELLAWYRRLGFETVGEVGEDPLDVWVVRRPRPAGDGGEAAAVTGEGEANHGER